MILETTITNVVLRYVVTYKKLRILNEVIGTEDIDFCGKSKRSPIGTSKRKTRPFRVKFTSSDY